MNNSELLLNEYETQLTQMEAADAIVLYGKSVIYPIIQTALRDLEIKKDILLFDKGVFIEKVPESFYKSKLVVFLCGARRKTRDSMQSDAKNFFSDYQSYDYYAIYYKWLISVIRRNCDYKILADTLISCRNEEAIANIDSINTFYCNLNCKECSNGIQYRKNKRHISREKQIFYLDKITAKLPIAECNFQGGEVFLEKDFDKFVLEHAKNSRIAILTVATNGTILPSDDFFRVMRETGAMFRISNYGEISKCMEQIMEKAKEWNIPCIGFPRAEEWCKFGDFYKRNRTDEELNDIRNKCCFGTRDMMFFENKLLCCLRTLFADAIQHDAEAVRLNTLDLDSNFSKSELEDIVNGKYLWKMCDYCDFPMEIITPGEQMSRRNKSYD